MNQVINNSITETNRHLVNRILLCLDGSDTAKIGDMIVAVSNIKLLKHFFHNARISVNSPSGKFSMLAENVDFIDTVSKYKPQELEFNDFDLVLLYVDQQSHYSRIISEYLNGKECGFRLFRLNEPFNYEERLAVPSMLESLLKFNYPKELLLDIAKRELVLSENEIAEGTQILNNKLLNKDCKLILFVYTASSYTKILRMSVVLEMINYFQSFPDHKLVLFDPLDDRSTIFRSMNVNIENVIILNGISLRQTFSVMADERIDLILGPCTGLMHGASGIYNSLMKRKLRSSPPTMVVLTGLYEKEGFQSAFDWWNGSLAKCLVLKLDETGNKRIYKVEDIEPELPLPRNILPCREYTAAMIRDYLYQNFNIGTPAFKYAIETVK